MRYFVLLLINMLMHLSLSSFALAIKVQNNTSSGELALTAEERRYLLDKQQLKMCVDPDWMPFEKIENNQHIGMSADFMNLFAKKIGITISLQASDSWMNSLAMGKQRQCDFFL